MWLALLLSCSMWVESGPDRLVGRLVTTDGTPLPGVRVESLEQADHTDGKGYFSVYYKEPNQSVRFTAHPGGAEYIRSYQPADSGRIDLELPETRDLLVRCHTPQGCMVDLAWDLGGGLEATAGDVCGAGIMRQLRSVPRGKPTATCRGGQPLQARFTAGELLVQQQADH